MGNTIAEVRGGGGAGWRRCGGGGGVAEVWRRCGGGVAVEKVWGWEAHRVDRHGHPRTQQGRKRMLLHHSKQGHGKRTHGKCGPKSW